MYYFVKLFLCLFFFRIEPAPPYMKDGPAGYYLNGTPDGSRDGTFRVNVHKFEEW